MADLLHFIHISTNVSGVCAYGCAGSMSECKQMCICVYFVILTNNRKTDFISACFNCKIIFLLLPGLNSSHLNHFYSLDKHHRKGITLINDYPLKVTKVYSRLYFVGKDSLKFWMQRDATRLSEVPKSLLNVLSDFNARSQ